MKPKAQPISTEHRTITEPVEIRKSTGKAAAKGAPVIGGYAALFNKLSENLGGADNPFYEQIASGAFDDVLGDDVRALFNHDSNLILARSRNGRGTLKLSVDEVGLGYQFDTPDTTAGRDLRVSVERGDVDQSSFGFTVADEKWEESNGVVIRTIKKIARLLDVSPVTYPAYHDTAVAIRGLKDYHTHSRRNPRSLQDLDRERRFQILSIGYHQSGASQ